MSDAVHSAGDPATQGNPGGELPPESPEMAYPFFYGSLNVCEALYLVPAERLRPYLKDSGLELYVFEKGQGCVGFNFQMYTSQFANGMGTTMEIELNIVAYPAERAAQVPRISFVDFVLGLEQTKLLGNHRVWVPCDDQVAIDAGVQKFGEPKFKTQFIPDLVTLNSPQTRQWSFVCCDPSFPPPTSGQGSDAVAREHAIFTFTADLRDLDAVMSNPSPITEYGYFPTDPEHPEKRGRLIGARWNILQPWQTCFLSETTDGRITLAYGSSTHPMQGDMKQMIGDAPPRVVRTVTSPPSAIQSRSYYP
jgi:hypothetical protein